MRNLILAGLAALALARCGGGGGGKPSCSGAGSCPAGSYCAQTSDGNVCWPDATQPTLGGVSLTCSTSPCRRDAVLHASAQASDDVGVTAVKVTLDLDGVAREMASQGGGAYALDVPLAGIAFPWFEHGVQATAVATDEAGNASLPSAAGLSPVTRARWSTTLKTSGGLALSSPAVLPEGQIALNGSDSKLYIVAKGGQSFAAVPLSDLASGPPAVATDAIWVATQDGALHKVEFDGVEVALTDCATSQPHPPLIGPPAIVGERTFVVSTAKEMLVAKASNACSPYDGASAATSPSAIASSGHVFVGAGSTLRSLTMATNGAISEDWASPPSVGANVDAQPLPSATSIWTVASGGAVNVTKTSDASTSLVTTISLNSPGAIILSDGSAIVSDAGNKLVRVSASGTLPWSSSDTLSGAPEVGLALGGAHPSILVPTAAGKLHAVDPSTGHVIWTAALSAQPLQPANVWTEPGAATSTAYVSGADGSLYAVIVDGELDTAAPWPKAFHDARNTSNAGTAP